MPSVLIVFSNSSILEEKIQCLIQNPGNDPVASVASGFCPMFGKPADKRLAVLSAVENCIEETVECSISRTPELTFHVLRDTYLSSSFFHLNKI